MMISMTGAYVLVAAVLLAGVIAVGLRWKNGRFTGATGPGESPVATLTPADLGAALGERATLVQFSSAFCSPCRATRVIVNDVAGRVEGVRAIEIDVESHLQLAEREKVMRTPTVFVLDATGRVVRRASGLPTRDQVLAAVADALGPSA